MKKKMLSLVLATAMLVGASMTVFAAPTTITDLPMDEGDGDIVMDATVQKATIKVTVEQAGTIIANPYGLSVASVDVDGENSLEGATIKFTNESNAAIEVGLKGSITLADYSNVDKADQVTIASDAKSIATATTKQVYVQAEIVDSIDAATNKAADDAVYLADAKGVAVKPLVYAAKAAEIATAPVLAKKDYDTDADGAVKTAVEEMAVVISGATSTSATSMWTDDDAFTVTTTYDLKLAKTPSAFVAKTK